MKNRNISNFIKHIRSKYFNVNTLVVIVAFVIAASWVWGSLGMMQRNYALQKELDFKTRQLALTELQRDNLALEKKYYETEEYQELAVRESLALVRPGERVLILPENTPQAGASAVTTEESFQEEPGNLEQWVNFLFGGYSRSIDAE
jgi:hypothetical protein